MGCVNSKKTAPKAKPTNEKPKEEKRKVSEKTLVKDTDNERQSSLFITDPKAVTKGRVEDHYEIKKEIGRGTFSVVKEGVHRETKERVALKFIDKKYVDKEDLMLLAREIDIMKKVNHPNVLSLKEIFETSKQITLVMELVTGGELFFKIVDRGSYNERDAALIVRQIVSGVKYLHSLGIAHRDLKPENLLCSGEGEAMQIKIADFGLSKIFAGGQQLETSCGTPDYAAPEVLNGGQIYDKSVDLWSVGVITYVLLCGYPPFYASSQPALFEKIIKAQYDFPKAEWDYISDVAKDFVKTLLLLDPQKRMTADECLAHPFLAVERSAGATLNIENSLADYSARRRKERGITPVKDDSEDSD